MLHTPSLLRLNGLTCSLFGAGFVARAPEVASFLGAFPVPMLRGIGALLLLHAAHLFLASRRPRIGDRELYYFSGGDLLWFLASLWLVVGTEWVTTGVGVASTIFVAVAVACTGLAQLWSHAESASSPRNDPQAAELHLSTSRSRLGAIGASWWSLPRWVKYWLFALNAVFLGSLGFLDEPLGRVVLAAWFASGPLLAAIMIVQRGLTRLLGLAHLIPWIPLVLYLELRLVGDMLGPRITWSSAPLEFAWVALLLMCLYVCLVLDAYDVLRWVRGERWRFGSPRHRAERSGAEVTA